MPLYNKNNTLPLNITLYKRYFQSWAKNSQIWLCRILKMAPNLNYSSLKYVYTHFWKDGHSQIWAHEAFLMILTLDYAWCLYLYYVHCYQTSSTKAFFYEYMYYSVLKAEKQTLHFHDYITMADIAVVIFSKLISLVRKKSDISRQK